MGRKQVIWSDVESIIDEDGYREVPVTEEYLAERRKFEERKKELLEEEMIFVRSQNKINNQISEKNKNKWQLFTAIYPSQKNPRRSSSRASYTRSDGSCLLWGVIILGIWYLILLWVMSI